jgi:hypothetical protein
MLRFTIAIGVLVGLVGNGCGGGSGPSDELKSLFEILASPNVAPSRFSEQLIAALDSETRAAVVARAKALEERLGVPVAPADVLQLHGVVDNARVTRIETIHQDAERATLELTFNPIAIADAPADRPPPDAAPGATPAAASATTLRLSVVKEDGRWRMSFGGLAGLVSSLALAAPAPDPAGPASSPAPPSGEPEPSEMGVP